MATNEYGASRAAIAAHYDVSDEFYELWLGRTLTYSCALWSDGDSLEAAQLRKLDYHAREVGCPGARRVLDIGCGWGSMLNRLAEIHHVDQVVGITPSRAQEARIRRRNKLRQIDVRFSSWETYGASEQYDGIVSIGALEHFVRPGLSSCDRIDVYRKFFEKCRSLLRPGGRLSLQTSAYARGAFVTGAIASIFPESDLPRLSELITAAEGVLEVVSIRNDRNDYAKTCNAWLRALRRRRSDAVLLVGEGTVHLYESFLEAAVKGFEREIFHLLRITLSRFDPPR